MRIENDLPISYQLWLNSLVKRYEKAYNSYENTYLKVYYEKGIRWYPLKQRYSEDYQSAVYSRLKPLHGLLLHSFWTLTFALGRRYSFQKHKKILNGYWKNFRSLWSKCLNVDGSIYRHNKGSKFQCRQFKNCRSYSRGQKNMDYLRVFELTKNYVLHIHLAIFVHIDPIRLKALVKYWDKNVGFVKLFTYSDHMMSYVKTPIAMAMFSEFSNDEFPSVKMKAWMSESWVEKNEIYFLPAIEVSVGSKVAKYVHKYMTKTPPIEHRAIFAKFHVRSYACSNLISKMLTSITEDWKDKQEKEELGMVIGTEMDFIPNEIMLDKKDMLVVEYKKRSKYTYIVEITFQMDEVDKNYITIPFSIDYVGVCSVYTPDSYRSVHWAERGIVLNHYCDTDLSHTSFRTCRCNL